MGQVHHFPGRSSVNLAEKHLEIKLIRNHFSPGEFKLSFMNLKVGFALGISAATEADVIRTLHITVHGLVAFGAARFVGELDIFGVGNELPFAKQANVPLFLRSGQTVSVYRIRAAFWAMDLHNHQFTVMGFVKVLR